MKNFSFLLPTRANVALALRFLQSARDTADDPAKIEVVLGVDEDDSPSHAITLDGLDVKPVIVPPGLTMGSLNRACFEASTGRYVMLINDDVIVRTPGWDTAIYRALARFPDEVALVHVNDLLFRERLCTFPVLSRKACLAIGVCPACYRRYCIDDHIYDTYHLLAYLGHNRRIYLDQVVFEHDNYQLRHRVAQADAAFFKSKDGKTYVPNPESFEPDHQEFLARLDQRKSDARTLAGLIESSLQEQRQAAYAIRLGAIGDSAGYRPDCPPPQTVHQAKRDSASDKVTVAVVSQDIGRPHARRCLALLKQHTPGCELVVLDNNRGREVHPARAMNRAMQAAATDLIVLLRDDVFVTAGWLEGLIAAIDERTGIIAPLQRDHRGRVLHSGVCLLGDGGPRHGSTTDVPAEPRAAECLSGAALLIDRRKCAGLLFNEDYQRDCFDLDYSLRVWEAGYRVVCTPRSVVACLDRRPAAGGSSVRDPSADRDMATFAATWIVSGRLAEIQKFHWAGEEYLSQLDDLRRKIGEAFDAEEADDDEPLECRIEQLLTAAWSYSVFREAILEQLANQAEIWRVQGMRDRVTWASQVTARCQPTCGATRVVRRIQRTAMQLVTNQIVAPARKLIREKPALQRFALQTRRGIRQAYQTYLDLPSNVRRMLDPPVFLAKRYLRPLVEGVVEGGLGLYKGYRLVQMGQSVQALPMSGCDTSGRNGRDAVLGGNDVRQLKALIDKTGAVPVGPLWLAKTPPARPESPAAVDEYRGVRILAFEGRYFGLTNGHGFDPARLRGGADPTCLVGHSVADIHALVDDFKHRNGSAKYEAPPATTDVTAPALSGGANSTKPRALLVCRDANSTGPAGLDHLADYDVTLLAPKDYNGPTWDLKTLRYPRWAEGDPQFMKRIALSADGLQDPSLARYDVMVVPYWRETFWKGTGFEHLATTCAKRFEVLLPDGTSHSYRGEDIRRLVYNKAHLKTLVARTSIEGKRVLDVGCSDGLACDLLLHERPESITGVDLMESVGCVFHDPRITYERMDAARLEFADESFDVCYCIATLEHCPDPHRVLQEMKRVTKRGGVAYVQAGPLYYSPLGHHMFGYFDDFPWIHLRLGYEGILEHCRAARIDETIRAVLRREPEDYVAGMLNARHINGLSFQEYRVIEFAQAHDIEVLSFTRSSAGRDLLTPDIGAEVRGVPQEDLLSEGFELAFRRR